MCDSQPDQPETFFVRHVQISLKVFSAGNNFVKKLRLLCGGVCMCCVSIHYEGRRFDSTTTFSHTPRKTHHTQTSTHALPLTAMSGGRTVRVLGAGGGWS